MMKFVVKTTKPYNVKTVVSMNPIMVDGTGMCGGCRLTVGGKTKFACVDGPDFDGFEVDFDEAMHRGTMYRDFEAHAREAECNLLKKELSNMPNMDPKNAPCPARTPTSATKTLRKLPWAIPLKWL